MSCLSVFLLPQQITVCFDCQPSMSDHARQVGVGQAVAENAKPAKPAWRYKQPASQAELKARLQALADYAESYTTCPTCLDAMSDAVKLAHSMLSTPKLARSVQQGDLKADTMLKLVVKFNQHKRLMMRVGMLVWSTSWGDRHDRVRRGYSEHFMTFEERFQLVHVVMQHLANRRNVEVNAKLLDHVKCWKVPHEAVVFSCCMMTVGLFKYEYTNALLDLLKDDVLPGETRGHIRSVLMYVRQQFGEESAWSQPFLQGSVQDQLRAIDHITK
jgi:hypothetical protein